MSGSHRSGSMCRPSFDEHIVLHVRSQDAGFDRHHPRIVSAQQVDAFDPGELKTMVPAGLVELEFSEREQLAAAQSALDSEHNVSRATRS